MDLKLKSRAEFFITVYALFLICQSFCQSFFNWVLFSNPISYWTIINIVLSSCLRYTTKLFCVIYNLQFKFLRMFVINLFVILDNVLGWFFCYNFRLFRTGDIFRSDFHIIRFSTIIRIIFRPRFLADIGRWMSKLLVNFQIFWLIKSFGQSVFNWLLFKGQLISKANFKVFIWTKKWTQILLYFCPSL